MNHFVHPQALCESSRIGSGTRIWAFAHVLPGASIGQDCNICDHVFIENDVVVGDRVTIKCGVQAWDGVRLGDDVFVGPNATFTNDLFPRSKQRPERYETTVVEAGASIGANATILAGVTIGSGAMVGAGAVVTRSVPPHAIVRGNPARISGYTDMAGADLASVAATSATPTANSITPLFIGEAKLYRFPQATDLRGSLVAVEFQEQLPFVPQRVFFVYDVSSERVRGEHAHRQCHQFLVTARGACCVVLDDGNRRQEVRLDSPAMGLYLPPMVWGIQYKFTTDAVVLVLASHSYDPTDYIRNYAEFLREIGGGQPRTAS
jgi:UDP-2-acetamido-3-amino-2,3-dideoxy-glucuronate N-acetyltransferase